MRITSGILKGRTFKVPKDGVRPTTERTREAVFSSLMAHVPGARVLDLFAGAGSLGLEAWSRGAASVAAVEKVSNHWKILEKNFQSLEPTASDFSASRRKSDPSFQGSEKQEGAGSACLGDWEVVKADVYDYLKRPVGPFDLIFADPPYDEVDLPKLLEALGDALAPEGLLVFEMHKRDSYTLPSEWKLLKEKQYGSTKVIFLEQVK
ncbi:MAG: RsmD family RNA methyltransferase [Verrucomicrobia bacterium]|nr:RsmD family RNA methyltransferase [Verrucomicrobiota bacterium]